MTVRIPAAGRLALLFLLLVSLLGGRSAPVGAALGAAPTLDDPNGVMIGEAAWADYDHDGVQELLVTGRGKTAATTFIYEPTPTGMVASPLGLKPLESSSAAWGDYDNDGWPDLLLTGMDPAAFQPYTGVWHNVAAAGGGRTFVEVATLTGIYEGKGRWGDYDNDGRPDILLTGYRKNPNPGTPAFLPATLIYHNECCGNFSFPAAANAGLTGLSHSAANWGDFNMDGYLDFAITGMQETWTAGDPETTPVAPRTLVYMNSYGSNFTLIPTSMPGLWKGSVNWYDYNRDGSIDLLITGNADTIEQKPYNPQTRLYRYNDTTKLFEQVPIANLPGLWTSTVVIGDYNNDGYPDLLVNGRMQGSTKDATPTALYTYNKSTGDYNLEPLDLPKGGDLLLAMGDFDSSAPPDQSRDNTLDVVISGVRPGDGKYHTYFYHNTPDQPNSPPAAPLLRAACWNGDTAIPKVEFYWNTAKDDHDPMLTYNLSLGSNSQPANLMNPLSDGVSGYHYLPQPGNMNVSTYYPTTELELNHSYNWSVQAVDAAYVGGPFSAGGQVNLGQSVAVADSLKADMNRPTVFLTSDLTANDNPAYQPVSYLWKVSPPAHGTLIESAAGTLTYTPNPNFQGLDTFSYYAVGYNTYCTAASVTIDVGDYNFPPTAIRLTPNILTEQPAGWVYVGALSATDPDPEQTVFTYQLVPGAGDTDNARFEIRSGSQLWAYGPLTLASSPYSLRIQVTDSGSPAQSYAQALQVFIGRPMWMPVVGR